jgi:hypothetical protein
MPHAIFTLLLPEIQDGEAWEFSKQCSLTSGGAAQKILPLRFFVHPSRRESWKVTVIVEIFNANNP